MYIVQQMSSRGAAHVQAPPPPCTLDVRAGTCGLACRLVGVREMRTIHAKAAQHPRPRHRLHPPRKLAQGGSHFATASGLPTLLCTALSWRCVRPSLHPHSPHNYPRGTCVHSAGGCHPAVHGRRRGRGHLRIEACAHPRHAGTSPTGTCARVHTQQNSAPPSSGTQASTTGPTPTHTQGDGWVGTAWQAGQPLQAPPTRPPTHPPTIL
jgi:hypothetical protein